MFSTDSTILLKALSKLGQGIHFGQNNTTAIQWNNLKDSLPAPPNYITDKINEWKSDDYNTWNTIIKDHRKILDEIFEGIELLNQFIPQAKTGFDYLEAWSKAAYHQQWQGKLGEQIIKEAPSVEYATLASGLKIEAQHYFERMETPQSAAKNAGLIFDCLIEYFHSGFESTTYKY